MLSSFASAFAAEEETAGHAVYWVGTIQMEGHDGYFTQDGKSYEPINYNGNIYVPLFMTQEWLAATARWDPAFKQISVHLGGTQPLYYRTASEMPTRTNEQFSAWQEKLETGRTQGFEVTVLTDTSVFGDLGEVNTTTPQGTTLYPIVYEGVPYLSVRTIAQLGDKTLCYFPELEGRSRATICIYQRPSQQQLADAQTYLDDVSARIQAADAYLATLAQAQTMEELHDALVELKALLQEIKDPAIPSIPTLTQEVLNSVFYYGVDGHQSVRALDADIAWSAGLTNTGNQRNVAQVRDLHVRNIHMFHETLSSVVVRMGQIVDGMAAGEVR